jgi:hypothetical protein
LKQSRVVSSDLQDELVARMVDPTELWEIRRLASEALVRFDLNDEQFVAAIAKLHCDEPASVANVPSNVTADRFGTVKRHYIRCMDDMGLTKATQDLMIALVDEALGSRTSVHSMDTSHSPFYSQPAELAEILVGIAT